MSHFSRLHGLLSGLGFLLAGCSTHQGKPDTPPPGPLSTDYDLQRDIRFSPPDWPQALLADLYQPRGAGPWPGVLLIHGGGWEGGDRDQVASLARRLARRGFLVFNTTYRLAPDWQYPTQLDDVRLAYDWLRAHAADYRLRADRIAAWGYSAGAHLAALLGTVDAAGKGSRPAAVVAGGIPSDLTKFPGGKLVPQFLGTRLQENPARFREASPFHHVSTDDPPFFLYHGGQDRLVPLDHAEDLDRALREAGVYSELFILRGRGHITAFLTDGPAFEAGATFLDRCLRGEENTCASATPTAATPPANALQP